jgi:CRISPR-associated protein (TIGR03986 family)
MNDVKRGRLVWSKDRKRRLIVFPTKKGGDSPPSVFDLDQLAAALRNRQEDVIEVDLELVGGKPMRIRPAGEPWAAAPPPPVAQTRPPASRLGGRPGPQGQSRGGGPGPGPALPVEFHNPYNFIPARPRDREHPDLGDALPAGHDRYLKDRYSGTVRVRLTTVTPLLLLDAARATEERDGHKIFPVRLGADGRPYLPPTSIKGMLRSAFEAVTNSRFGVFSDHDERLAYRMPASEGLRLVPVRVEEASGALRLRLLRGTSTVGRDGRPQGPMYAAWLPRYGHGPLPVHRDGPVSSGEEVWCWVENVRHDRGFTYWRVRVLAKSEASLGPPPSTSPPPPGPRASAPRHQPNGELRKVRGWAYITNQNINRKHDERVFFEDSPTPTYVPLTAELKAAWGELVRNYQTIHVRDLERRAAAHPPKRPDQYLGREPGEPAWSVHVYRRGADQLVPGDLAYAEVSVDARGNTSGVNALYPVMISRGLHEVAPRELLAPLHLLPARDRDELSPAERVFGWVNQDGAGAYRGNLRIGPVTCRTPLEGALLDASAYPIPLAILGEPKPQQARFYVGASSRGESQPRGLAKLDAGYHKGKGLRGRKVYPHHRGLPPDYWDQPEEDRTQTEVAGHFQEYRRPRQPLGPTGLSGEQRDDQNRSVLGWVEPGTEFTFDLHVTNLSKFELGTLLWLLCLPPEHYHRLGGGKPLGFGSVRLDLEPTRTDIRDGAGWKTSYLSLIPADPDPETRARDLKGLCEECLGTFDQVVGQQTFVRAFLAAARGFHLPIHYPRSTRAPHPEGKAYEWFVANDRERQGTCIGLPLGDLAGDPGLPFLG